MTECITQAHHLPDAKVATLVLPDDAALTAKHRSDLRQDVTVLRGSAQAVPEQAGGEIKEVAFTAIP